MQGGYVISTWNMPAVTSHTVAKQAALGHLPDRAFEMLPPASCFSRQQVKAGSFCQLVQALQGFERYMLPTLSFCQRQLFGRLVRGEMSAEARVTAQHWFKA